MSTQTKDALSQIEKILKPVLDPTDLTYKIVANALLTTISILSESVAAQAKEKYGFYLASTGYGIIQIHYYFYFRQIEAQYLACKTTQTLIGYSYAVSSYEEDFNLKKLGSLVEGMDLKNDEKKQLLIKLTKFATDGNPETMKKMKEVQKDAEDFW